MMYERLSALMPNSFLHSLRVQLNYNGIPINEKKFAGFLLLFGVSLATVASGVAGMFGLEPAFAFIGVLFLFYFGVYALMRMNSEGKGKFVEGVLPDALQLIASNMKSGLTTERALFVAGRPEFGLLQVELKNASKRISSGEQVERALIGISDKINSTVLKKTLWLICEGIKSGGQISDLLFQLASDLKTQQALEDESKSNISIYVLLILFASMLGAPLLFGVSSFVVQIISTQIEKTPKLNVQGLPVGGNMEAIKSFATGERKAVSPEFVVLFSCVTLIFTSIFACLTIGAINTGKEINGLKYVVPIIAVSIIIFFATRMLLLGTLGDMV
ncbi:Type II secretion system (T2SS), protein F [uncultured archaeon]|nr:Type II secretion system (T2SS), protein F [uncultured archaeon]